MDNYLMETILKYEDSVLQIFYKCKSKREVYEITGLSKRNNKAKVLDYIIDKHSLTIDHFSTKKYFLISRKCPSCEIIFDTYNDGKLSNVFCSISCSNRNRKHSDETKDRIRTSIKNSELYRKSVVQNKEKRKSEKDKWDLVYQKRKEKVRENLLNSEYTTLSFDRLKQRIVYEQNECCNKCGLDKWLDIPISLELEHKDGNRNNNSRDNLECLCPNCHSQTSTWRGRNKNSNRDKVSDEQLLMSLIDNDFNFRQSLLSVNLTPKGGNYNRCHRLKREYDEVSSQRY